MLLIKMTIFCLLLKHRACAKRIRVIAAPTIFTGIMSPVSENMDGGKNKPFRINHAQWKGPKLPPTHYFFKVAGEPFISGRRYLATFQRIYQRIDW